jgi:hypothetical protein
MDEDLLHGLDEDVLHDELDEDIHELMSSARKRGPGLITPNDAVASSSRRRMDYQETTHSVLTGSPNNGDDEKDDNGDETEDDKANDKTTDDNDKILRFVHCLTFWILLLLSKLPPTSN